MTSLPHLPHRLKRFPTPENLESRSDNSKNYAALTEWGSCRVECNCPKHIEVVNHEYEIKSGFAIALGLQLLQSLLLFPSRMSQ